MTPGRGHRRACPHWPHVSSPPRPPGPDSRLSGARAGASTRLLMTVRDAERGAAAPAGQRASARDPRPADTVLVDLADLSSVRAAAAEIREHSCDRVDVVINHAAVSPGPHKRTRDGVALQTGTDHRGPTALTWPLTPAARSASTDERASRVEQSRPPASATAPAASLSPTEVGSAASIESAVGMAQVPTPSGVGERDGVVAATGRSRPGVPTHRGSARSGRGRPASGRWRGRRPERSCRTAVVAALEPRPALTRPTLTPSRIGGPLRISYAHQ